MQLGFEHECSVEVLSKKINVHIEDSLDEYGEGEDDYAAIGLWVFQDHTIHLKEGLEMDVAEETLFHELVHAVENELFLGLSEKKVSALSAVLYDTLKRNGLLKNMFKALINQRVDLPIRISKKNKNKLEEFTLND